MYDETELQLIDAKKTLFFDHEKLQLLKYFSAIVVEDPKRLVRELKLNNIIIWFFTVLFAFASSRVSQNIHEMHVA